MSHEYKQIDIASLVVSVENPRFEMVSNTREAFRLMIEDQKKKLANIAQDIIENGVNPSDLPIVAPHLKIEKHYNVMEGNRRVIAIKLLNNPDLIPDKDKSLLKKFKTLSEEFKKNPIDELLCVVFQEEDEANKWIELKHTGENNGAGTASWNAQQKERFDERVKGTSSYTLQIIDFLKKDKNLNEEIKKALPNVPSSSLQRLVGDPDIRNLIGIEVKDGNIISHHPPSEIIKPLTKIIKDLLDPEFKVKDIYHKDDRLNYIETFKKAELPDKSLTTNKWEIITSTPPTSKSPVKRSKPISISRDTIIPKSCIIHINQKRINTIYRELKDLALKDSINAAAITFRVFVELTIDEFIEKKNIPSASNDDKLKNKLDRVKTYLKDNNLLNRDQLKPINVAISNPNSILSINTFNAYVHNKHFHPIATDLKTTWDNIEPFIVQLWELI